MTLSDGRASLDVTGRCDDGSDDSLVSPGTAEKAALKGIGKLTAIEPVMLQVALKKSDAAESLRFSWSWVLPRTVLHLPSGKFALTNISFLVPDDELACEGLIIGSPVLKHLLVDPRTLLDSNRLALDGADCSTVDNIHADKRSGYVSLLKIRETGMEKRTCFT